MGMFTELELGVLYRTQLYEMARNLKLDINRKTKKGELIERLLECEVTLKTTVSTFEVLPPMSVQVRRIYESSKGE